MIRFGAVFFMVTLLLGCGHVPPRSYEPDVIDVTLPASTEQVKTALKQVCGKKQVAPRTRLR